MTLTPNMREALSSASKQPLRRTHTSTPGSPAWPAHPATLAALVRHQLLTTTRTQNRHGHPVDLWTITDAGRDALKPPPTLIRPDRPRYLAVPGAIRYRLLPSGRWKVMPGTGDYTTDPRASIDIDHAPATAAVEALSHADLDELTHRAHRREQTRLRQHGDQLDELTLDERLRRADASAIEQRVDLRSQIRLARHLIDQGRNQAATQRLEQIEARLRQRAA